MARDVFINPPLSQTDLTALANYYIERVDRQARCAIPTNEQFNAQFGPPPLQTVTLIATDGSQALPPPYSVIEWRLVNLACVTWKVSPDGNYRIKKKFRTDLYLENYRAANGDWMTVNEHLDMVRDTSERTWLAENGVQTKQHDNNLICFLDNPLEAWGARAQAPGNYQISNEISETAYKRLTEARVPYAGVVGSADSSLLIRLLEVALSGWPGLKDLTSKRQLSSLRDSDLLGTWLKPGNRSSIFRMGGRASGLYSGDLALHTLYLNVSQSEAPVILRLELPGWVAMDEHLVGQIHAHLLNQCHLVDGIPYPHNLTIADRSCQILPREKRYTDRLVRQSLLKAAIILPSPSGKIRMKRVTRRKKRR